MKQILVWLVSVVFSVVFHWLGRRSSDDKRQIDRWKKIISRFRGKSVKMIKNAGSKFDDYSITPKLRQILLYWGCELTEKDFLLTQFQAIIYVTSKFNFCRKTNTFLVQFQTIIYVTSEFNFCKKKKYLFWLNFRQ